MDDWETEFPFGKIFCETFVICVLGISGRARAEVMMEWEERNADMWVEAGRTGIVSGEPFNRGFG